MNRATNISDVRCGWSVQFSAVTVTVADCPGVARDGLNVSDVIWTVPVPVQAAAAGAAGPATASVAAQNAAAAKAKTLRNGILGNGILGNGILRNGTSGGEVACVASRPP
jgi:hypothetical protein